MDSDEEHDQDHDEGAGDHEEGGGSESKQTTALTGFLFGNIDKEGKLEDDVLDEVPPVVLYKCRSLSDLTLTLLLKHKANCGLS